MSSKLENGSLVMVLEGLIGTGKTTLSEALSKSGAVREDFDEIVVIGEPLKPKALDAYIGDKAKHAFWFQMNTALKRIYGNRQAKQLALEKPRRLVVVDRGLDGDRAFAEMQFKAGLFDAQQKEIYDEEIGVDDGSALAWRSEPGFCTIYLRCTPETAWRRVLKRNIPGEVASYSLEYLAKLYDAHELILDDKNVVTIDWDNDLDLVNGRLEDLVKTKILDQI